MTKLVNSNVIYSLSHSCLDTKPEDELRLEAPQLASWVLICPNTGGDIYTSCETLTGHYS